MTVPATDPPVFHLAGPQVQLEGDEVGPFTAVRSRASVLRRSEMSVLWIETAIAFRNTRTLNHRFHSAA
jgi:hypothetical protein